MDNKKKYDTFKFIKGQKDCRDGVPHKSGQGESYDAGYNAEYAMSENKSKLAEMGIRV